MIHPIFVVGPQRCGSSIAARIIASDLNKTYVDESDYHPDHIPDQAVIQAPFLYKFVPELSFRFIHSHFVFVRRDKQEIIDSMERIEWYKDIIDHPDYYSATVDFAYNTIDSYKLTLTKDRWTDISYDSLKTHPLFIHDRKDFTVRQWQKDKPEGPTSWRNNKHADSYQVRL
tara:strand:+ start:495 stop:1010 length:516 start_codon:yes stop_codon:yes gene_type:complete